MYAAVLRQGTGCVMCWPDSYKVLVPAIFFVFTCEHY